MEFIVHYWPLWLIAFMLCLGVIVLTLFASGLSLLRGGRGGPGPYPVPTPAVIGACVSGGLLLTAIIAAVAA